MRPFEALSFRGQGRRLHRAATAALGRYGLAGARLTLLAHRGTALFRVDAADGRRFALRVYGAELTDPAPIRSVLLWLDALARETDLCVPAPVPAADGALLTSVTVPGVPGTRYCVLFSWVAGRFVDGGLAPVHLQRVGRLMAGLHGHAEGFVPPPGFQRPTPRWTTIFDSPLFTGAADARGLLGPRERAVVAAAAARVRAQLPALDRGPAAFGLIHADLQHTNFLFAAGEARAIDFEDCAWGHFLYDMAIPLFEIGDRPKGAAMRAAFLAGYAQVRPLPVGYDAGIRLFTAVRLAKRVRYLAGAADPALRAQAAHWVAYIVPWLETWLAE